MRLILIMVIVLILMFVSAARAEETQDSPDNQDINWALEGNDLDEHEVPALEKKLEQNPKDIESRIKLLGFYFRNRYSDNVGATQHTKHVLWMIQNEPRRSIFESPYCEIDFILDPEGFTKAKDIWMKQVIDATADTKILGNAANFFQIHDRDIAMDLLRRAKTAAPKDPAWPEAMGRLYDLETHSLEGQSRKNMSAKALAEFEAAWSLLNAPLDKFYLINSLSNAAFEAGDYLKAKDYAEKSLADAGKHRRDWNYGNAIHEGNIVLGRIALEEGDVASAKEHLLAAGKTPGSPQLNSFGPDMDLAAELLSKGERDAVFEYLQLCKNFWVMGGATLEGWANTVKANGIPDFTVRYTE